MPFALFSVFSLRCIRFRRTASRGGGPHTIFASAQIPHYLLKICLDKAD
jgi:hypothetical protein